MFTYLPKKRGSLYTRVTSNLVRPIYEHKSKAVDGFSKQHNVYILIYFEQHPTTPNAIQREKKVKHWSRKWKLDLVEKENLGWRDLYEEAA